MKQKHYLASIAFSLCTLASPLLAQTTLPAVVPCNYNLTLAGSPYISTGNIEVPNGCTMNVDPGVEIKMAENAHLIVRGKVNFAGTAAQPIHIHAVDSIWGNILLDSTLTQKSTFNYVIIEQARQSVVHQQEPGAIYGYFSSLEVTNCHFMNNLRCISNYKCLHSFIQNCVLDSSNRGEKLHHQYCNGTVIDHCTLYATNGDNDAIDFDASNNVTISNNFIYHGGDDGMDIGQCDSVGCDTVIIFGNYISHMFNKGISNGEYCHHIIIHHNIIVGCELGIGAKSDAHVWADHNTLYNNQVGVNSYQHLDQIWGPGYLTVTNCIIAGGDTIYHVDPTAYLTIAYSLSPDTLMPGTGNIKGDPKFTAPGIGLNPNFSLLAGSAAIDTGDPSAQPDPDGSRSDIGALYFGTASGIALTNHQTGFTIYPNPSNGQVRIRFIDTRSSTSKPELSIIDVTGRVIFKESIATDNFNDGVNVDLSKHPAGVYYLQIRSDNNLSSGKLVLE